MRFVIVTGVSGAGKSQAVKCLEDLGYFCVDNLPPTLMPKFAELCCQNLNKIEKVAMVVDIRGGAFFNDLFSALTSLKEMGVDYEILFLEASDDVLIKRFKESRRAHPLAPEGRVIHGVSRERKMLQELRDRASYIIDTSNLAPKELKEQITNILTEGKGFSGLVIGVLSFGFKYGIPIDCDLVFDVRFIPNPYYISSMKKLTGKNDVVKEYVLKQKETEKFLEKLYEMLEFLLPNYVKEGKTQLMIGIGCTGGRHRSVAIGDEVYRYLKEIGHHTVLEHRDIDKDGRGAR